MLQSKIKNVIFEASETPELAEIKRFHRNPLCCRSVDKELTSQLNCLLAKALKHRNLQSLVRANQILSSLADFNDATAVTRTLDALLKFSFAREISAESVEVFGKLIPNALSRGLPSVEALQKKAAGRWSYDPANPGLNDFICQCFTTRKDSISLNKLIHISRSIPYADLQHLEQNRKDAVLIAVAFSNLREYIHGLEPLVHKLLTAMLDFYKTGDPTDLKEVLSKTQLSISNDNKSLFDISRYEMRATSLEPAINVLKRLQENTSPQKIHLPFTDFPQINHALENLENIMLADKPDYIRFGSTLSSVNILLAAELDGEIGMNPTLVNAASWIEYQSALLLRGIDTFEEQQRLLSRSLDSRPTSSWFFEIVKFHDLISGDASQEPVNAFIDKIVKSHNYMAAARKLGSRVIENANRLDLFYRANGFKDTGFIWSGNLTHRLLNLVFLREGSSRYGSRVKLEIEKELRLPLFHPGD